MSKLIIGKIYTFTCIFILKGLIIGFGIAYLIEAKNFIDRPDNLWIFVLMIVITSFIFFISLIIDLMRFSSNFELPHDNHKDNAKHMAKHFNPLTYISSLMTLGLTIWSSIIYTEIRDNHQYPDHLYTYFMVFFIYYMILLSIFICLCCCGCLAICCGGGSIKRITVIEQL